MIDTESDVREADAAQNDSVEPETHSESQIADTAPDKKSTRRQLTISLRSLLLVAVVAALVAAACVLAWLYLGAQRKLDEQARQADNKTHAEKVALDYAVEAAAMNYQDLGGWKTKLVAGTSPELKEKLTKAATSMEQILVPLQWSSTARPLAAKVRAVNGGTYVVDSFVSVQTKTMQAPEPLQSTATYSVMVDSTKDWQITDVGGVGDALDHK
ncbi:hypothetical protein [Mycobacterium branderi]|uniref:Mce associated membrane protein n=1 Tax=Mycobacterium branderi TaxID=43348 RepID=A0A7I7WFP1_9MYCO|nr:hypothetical protein BST20_23150 [Mycobacterium branderi]BBZ15401.1 hypothetical protein MBRA_55960 [Mycobacterium branderi]